MAYDSGLNVTSEIYVVYNLKDPPLRVCVSNMK